MGSKRWIVLVLAAAAFAAVPSAAMAAQKFFHSPSGQIECELDYHQSGLKNEAFCQDSVAAVSVTLSPSGKLKRCTGGGCLGDGPENASTLGYGHSTGLGPFTCHSRRSGMSCQVSSGRGFTISRRGVQTIEHG
jgi:hypothetical protein